MLAVLFETGGSWLVWQGIRDHRGWAWIGAGILAPGAYGFVATFQPDAHFGRILAAYGGVFVAGSLARGMVADGFQPDRWDVLGVLVCLAGVALIMYDAAGRVMTGRVTGPGNGRGPGPGRPPGWPDRCRKSPRILRV